MQQNFLEVKRFLERKYPQLVGNIEGGYYPLPPTNQLIASVAQYVYMGGLFYLFGGTYIFQHFGIQEPEFLQPIQQNKVAAFGALFMINMIGANFARTGAFEVFVDGELVFSKLQTNRFPTINDMTNAFEMKGISDGRTHGHN